MDPVSFYNGTGRELTLGFRIISDDKVETSKNMINLQKLIQYQYAAYSRHKNLGIPVLTAPPYFEIKFMNVVSGGSKGSRLRGYINGPLQINPCFQSKDQAQYFSGDFEKLYFSDVTVVLRLQVLHHKSIGWFGNNFKPGNTYPYSSGVEVTPPDPTAPPEAQPKSGNTALAPGAQPQNPNIEKPIDFRAAKGMLSQVAMMQNLGLDAQGIILDPAKGGGYKTQDAALLARARGFKPTSLESDTMGSTGLFPGEVDQGGF